MNNNIVIKGTGSAVPEHIITNNDLEKIVNTSDEWITSRTGIKERRIVKDEQASDLSVRAATKAIENAGMTIDDIDMIIVATISPDMVTPATACIVQTKLGISRPITAFDINAACTGFIYGLNIATQMLKTGQNKNALVIGVETLSKITNWEDRNTCVLFGDGCGAVVLSVDNDTDSSIKYTYTVARGDLDEKLTVDYVKNNNPITKNDNNPIYISMNGREVFKFAVGAIKESIAKILEEENLTVDDVKLIVPHQANYRIIQKVANDLKIEDSKFYINLDKYGNTSAASIPLALDEANSEGRINKGDYVILVGFGGGLTWGATLIKW